MTPKAKWASLRYDPDAPWAGIPPDVPDFVRDLARVRYIANEIDAWAEQALIAAEKGFDDEEQLSLFLRALTSAKSSIRRAREAAQAYATSARTARERAR